MYENGQGTRQDYSKAIPWYTRAGYHGNKNTQYRAGIIYYDGKPGVSQDYTEALQWVLTVANVTLNQQAAIEQILHNAQHIIAKMYQSGYGTPVDYNSATA